MTPNLKERKRKILGKFKGVDFSSSPAMIDSSRAYLSKNLIFENGINRKRKGYKEIIKIKYIEDGKEIIPKINGIFHFVLYGEPFVLIYAGKRFFLAVGDDEYEDITFSSSTKENRVKESNLWDKRISMFQCGQKVFFIGCGDFLVFTKYNDKFELHRVENDSITYIPTTTIDIASDLDINFKGTRLDNINLLNSLRKNTLIGIDIPEGQTSAKYVLDSGFIDKYSTVTLKIQLFENDDIVYKTMTNFNSQVKKYLYYDNDINCNSRVGEIDFDNGTLEIFEDTFFMEGNANIEVTFSATIDDYAKRINLCDIGVLFGLNGNSDRLFLSGNNLYPNYDFYSSSEDFTYFEDTSYAKLGTSNTRIMSYTRLSDGTLAIHKEYSSEEPNVYFRTGNVVTNYSSNGVLIEYETYFPIRAGGIGHGVISKYCNANLNNDKLFLTNNGVYSLELSTNQTFNEYYAKLRSDFINEKLKKSTNLQEAVAIVFDNKYFLAVDNVCYIADGRFITDSINILKDTFNYEWWYWTNMPVRVFANIENSLWFGTSDGRVCIFHDGYEDILNEETSEGELLVDYENSKVIYSSDLKFKNDDIIIFKKNLYNLKVDSTNIKKVEDNKIYVDEDTIIKLYDGITVYAEVGDALGIDLYTPYVIANVDWGNCCFNLLTDYFNEIVQLEGTNFKLVENLQGKELYITNLENNEFNLKIKNGLDSLKLHNYYMEQLTSYTSIISIRNNVVAEWYSPMLDLGVNDENKTLLKLTISTEPTTNGKLKFGYRTKYNSELIEAKGMKLFDFNNLDFSNFSFNTYFANSYSVDLKDEFNYIQLYYLSDNNCDCSVQNMTITYKINKSNKGVE